MIPYGRQNISAEDIDAVVEVLKSDFLTQGTSVPLFEETIARFTGASHAVAVNSATSALHIACLTLGLGKGDWLWTSPISFVASANCGLYCGANVDFVDIDPRTYNMCPLALAEKLRIAEKSGCLPKVVIPVHLSGQSCDMVAIAQLSKKYGFKIIEDASHAIGGMYGSSQIGACRFSDITIFSFHPVKIITTAEGGMALCNDEHLAQKLQQLRSHGITRNPEQMTEKPEGDWYYQQTQLGYNYRMTELQAALGISQMKRLGQFINRRQQLATRYFEQLSQLPLVLPWQHPDSSSAWHLYIVRTDPTRHPMTRKELFDQLRIKGIGVNVHYIPIHTQPFYRSLGFYPGLFPTSEKYYSEAISLPLFHSMTDEQQNTVVETIKEILA